MKITNTHVCFLLIVSLCFLPSIVLADLQVVGHLRTGQTFDSLESEGYLYVAQGGEVRVYPLTDPSSLTITSYVAKFYQGDLIKSLAIQGDFLYIGDTGKLGIVDISHPLTPNPPTISLELPYKNQVNDVAIYGSYAYLALAGKGILVVDISDPSSPVVGRLLTTNLATPHRMNVSGGYLYVTLDTPNHSLRILGLADPSSPEYLGSFSAPLEAGNSYGDYSSVAVKGNYAFLAEWYYAFIVVDVSNPSSPREVTRLTGINPSDIQIAGNYAFVSSRYTSIRPNGGGIMIIDITNPTQPKLAGYEYNHSTGYGEGISVNSQGTYAFASFTTNGFTGWDIRNRAAPVRLPLQKGTYKIPAFSGDSVTGNGNFAYVGAHNDGIWVVDISDKANPQDVGFAYYAGRYEDVSVYPSGSSLYLYGAGEWANIVIFDVTNPFLPKTMKGKVGPNSNYAHDSIAKNGYLYSTNGIADISNPLSPIWRSSTQLSDRSDLGGRTFLQGTRLLSARSTGLQIWDVANKASPSLIATYRSGTDFNDVAATGSLAVAINGGYLDVVDLTQISTPVQVAHIPLGLTGYSVTVDDKNAYVCGAYGVRMINLTTHTVESSITLPNSGNPYNFVWKENSYLYVTSRSSLYIISTSDSPVNHAPVLDPIGMRSVAVETQLSFPISGSDLDGDPLTFSAAELPTGAIFDPQTRTFTWTPSSSQEGEYTVNFSVSDGSLIDYERVTIAVTRVNRAPVLAEIGPQTVTEGETLTILLSATDANGDLLSFGVAPMPFGAILTNNVFSWIPAGTQIGTYTLNFTVSDGLLMDFEEVILTVEDANRAPVLNPIGSRTVMENTPLTIILSASDADGDVLTFAATGLPGGASFDRNSGTFTWTPSSSQAGRYVVNFTVSDGNLYDYERVTITVEHSKKNLPPSSKNQSKRSLDTSNTTKGKPNATIKIM